jgi:hypothetical protein
MIGEIDGLGQKYNWWSFYALSKHIRVLGMAHVK